MQITKWLYGFMVIWLLGLLVPGWVWAQGAASGEVNSQVVEVRVEEVREEKIEDYDAGQRSLAQELRVIITAGERSGEVN